MANKQSKWIVLALVGACGFGAWKAGSALLGDEEAQGTQHLVNQVWIDHVPADDRDMIGHLVVLDHPQGKFGATGRSSQWRHIIEVFRWRLEGKRLTLAFPQERVRTAVDVETWRCEGEAPAPFQLCLRLTNQRGQSVTLYSRDDWEVRPHELEDSLAELGEDAPMLRGVLDELALDEDSVERIDALDSEDWAERDHLPAR